MKVGADRGVRHDVAAERIYERNARIFAADAWSKFIWRRRFEGDAYALNAEGIAAVVEADASDADSRTSVPPHESRKDVEHAVLPSYDTRVEGAMAFEVVRGIGCHDRTETSYDESVVRQHEGAHAEVIPRSKRAKTCVLPL